MAFYFSMIETSVGQILAIASQSHLYGLDFITTESFSHKLNRFKKILQSEIDRGDSPIIHLIREALNNYFMGDLKTFSVPMTFVGTPFQKSVWTTLLKIPYAETCSYVDIAKSIACPTGSRAVANANAANRFPIIVPCHRVINSNGNLGGYAGGIDIKRKLLAHERDVLNSCLKS